MAHQNRKSGFTIVELLVVVSIIALLIALLLPAVQKGRDKALVTQSFANLKNLASANEVYAADWGDRQFTCIPDDFGTVNGNCGQYITQIACPPQLLLGYDGNGIWGYFLGGGKCTLVPDAGCGNIVVYFPMNLASNDSYGTWRLPGLKAFNAYLNNKFYDPILYAPKDRVPLETVAKYFTSPSEFTSAGGLIEESSYCWSPAAMYDAKVFKRNAATLNGQGFTAPNTLPAGYRSPPVSRCKYTSLKTRMIEHNWLQKPPNQITNPGFTGGTTPWFFNHGYTSEPVSLFFDGHIELVGCLRAQQAEQRAGRLWSRNTPVGTTGYFGAQSYDFLVNTSFHVLTTDGIEGRDVLGIEG